MSKAKAARRAKAKRGRPVRAPRGEGRVGAVEAALAALAHEVRTPLNGILAFGELLAASNLPERERGWASAIKGAAEHLAQLTTVVVDGAKADGRKLVLRSYPFRPRQIAEAVAATLHARAQTKGLTATVSIADDLPALVVGDPVRLRAALENLIDNAVKFTDRGEVFLEVTARRAARGRTRLFFTVGDSGIGLSAAEVTRLFRPFAQASEAVAHRFGGAGLGLIFVKRIARAMGGTLKIQSAPGRGSRFRLEVVAAQTRCGGAAQEPAHPVRRGQSLWPGRAQHDPHRARSPRGFRRHRWSGSGSGRPRRIRRRAHGPHLAGSRRHGGDAPHPRHDVHR